MIWERLKAESPGEKCPGEADCSDFRTASGTTREEKAADACPGCRLFSTKQTTLGFNGRRGNFTENLFLRVERLRRTTAVIGGTLDLETITPLEFEGLVIWTEAARQIKEQSDKQTLEMLAAVLGIKKTGF